MRGRGRLAPAAIACFLVGAALVVLVDAPAARAVGVLALAGWIVLGALAIAGPGAIGDEEEDGPGA